MTVKQKLRLHFRELRKSLTDDEYLRRCDAIAARVRSLPEFAHARTVHSYWPSVENREVDTRPLIEELAGRGTAVFLPVVETFGSTLGTPRLSHVLYTPGMKMKTNRWGIAEPIDRRHAKTDRFDLIFVPALACDKRGARLGHGLGYYDEFLYGTPGVKVCLCMDRFFVNSLPSEPHDVPIDIVVTETQTIRTEYPIMP